MELRDIIVTPFIISLVYVLAYLIRPRVTDDVTRKYFIPALSVKMFGALALGFIYQFYYKGGDTFNYHTHGSRHIWNAFMENPDKGIKLLTHDGSDYVGVYQYASKIPFINDPASFAVIKLATLCDLITFSSYSGTAILFCVLSFIGLWLLFLTFYDFYPELHKRVAIAVLFIPSVVFWGSGLMKDTITIACLGIVTYCTYRIFIKHSFSIVHILLLPIAVYFLYAIKIYILLAFLPSAVVWVFMYNYRLLNSPLLKIILFPIVVGGALFMAYFTVLKAGADNPKYSLDTMAKTAQITAYDIRYWTGRDAGSGYSLGELDGSWNSMLKLGPAAVNVSLFRPYLWEAKNPFMFVAAIESFIFLIFTLYALKFARLKFFRAFGNPTVMFCTVFSVTFAFAVGVSTYNFGTLMRYKIPLMPFYALAIMLIIDYANKLRNVEKFEETE